MVLSQCNNLQAEIYFDKGKGRRYQEEGYSLAHLERSNNFNRKFLIAADNQIIFFASTQKNVRSTQIISIAEIITQHVKSRVSK